MGNFKPVAMRTMTSGRERRRSILKGSIGVDGDNLPNDMRLIARALIEAGLLGPDAPQEDETRLPSVVQYATFAHNNELPTNAWRSRTLIPESDTDRTCGRALAAKGRFPNISSHFALSANQRGQGSPRTGVFLAKQRLKEILKHP